MSFISFIKFPYTSCISLGHPDFIHTLDTIWINPALIFRHGVNFGCLKSSESKIWRRHNFLPYPYFVFSALPVFSTNKRTALPWAHRCHLWPPNYWRTLNKWHSAGRPTSPSACSVLSQHLSQNGQGQMTTFSSWILTCIEDHMVPGSTLYTELWPTLNSNRMPNYTSTRQT